MRLCELCLSLCSTAKKAKDGTVAHEAQPSEGGEALFLQQRGRLAITKWPSDKGQLVLPSEVHTCKSACWSGESLEAPMASVLRISHRAQRATEYGANRALCLRRIRPDLCVAGT